MKSKELAALKRMHQRAMKCEQNISIQQTSDYIKLENALTPPTEEEVCKALSESIGHKVSYDKRRMLFSTSCYLVAELTIDGLFIGFQFKPHLITMLGRFYESKVKNNE